jgi:hypothetical protein
MRQIATNIIASRYKMVLINTIILFIIILPSVPQTSGVSAQSAANAKTQDAKNSPAKLIAGLDDFNERVKEYIKLRERLSDKADKPSDESKPLDIEAYQIALAEQIKVARAKAQAGDIFTPGIAKHIRQVIKKEFKGERLKELRELAQEPGPKGVPLKVNALYPEAKEIVEMPPTLLLKLPELPKQLRYRLLGRYMLLMDREARLIIDYLPNVLP